MDSACTRPAAATGSGTADQFRSSGLLSSRRGTLAGGGFSISHDRAMAKVRIVAAYPAHQAEGKQAVIIFLRNIVDGQILKLHWGWGY